MDIEEQDGVLPIESKLDALWAAGQGRGRATELVIKEAVVTALDSSIVVLVEGVSDQIALEIVAAKRDRHFRNEGVSIVPMGGATNIRRFLTLFGARGREAKLAGLYDLAEESHIRRGLEQGGLGRDLDPGRLESLGFFVCVTDLEDELIRCLGSRRVEQVIEVQGELASLRKMQNEPFHRGRPPEQHLHRFIGVHSGRKYRYARLLAEALDPASIPGPLERLLSHL